MSNSCHQNASVIVSTYREPEQVCLVLLALARQTLAPAEVLVADDGSPDETRDALAVVSAELPFRLVHVWQPDDGFRLARSRNNAIFHARGEAIAFLDQDTLPHRFWLERHLSRLNRGRVCTGLVLRLSESAARRLTRDSVRRGEFETWHTTSEYRRLEGLQMKYQAYALLRRCRLGIKNRPSLAFGNASAFRNDLIRVNGFDEDYVGWGQEDDDLGRRLYRAGVRPVALVNRALVSHIPHASRRSAEWKSGANVERYQRKLKSFRCEIGLDAHPHPDVHVTEF